MLSYFSNNQFITKNKNNNNGNNTIAMIEKLFLNIKYKLLYKKLIKKEI